MAKYRKKPAVVEAVQWTGRNWPEVAQFHRGDHFMTERIEGAVVPGDNIARLLIRTLEGTMRADPGDWIIRGVKGELYPCKPEIFEATYEPAE